MRTKEEFEKAYKIDSRTDCWIWQRGLSEGYGSLRWIDRSRLAHHVSFSIYKGKEVPRGMLLRHTCHNTKCVNPDHLTLGTHAENSRDNHKLGLSAYGPSFGKYYGGISDDNVLQAFLMRRWGMSYADIGLVLNKSKSFFMQIEHNRSRTYLKNYFEQALAVQGEI